MVRTGFVVRMKVRLSQGLISVYEYLKANDPGSIKTLSCMNLFDEMRFLAGSSAARYVPLSEELSVSELRQLMAAPRGRHER